MQNIFLKKSTTDMHDFKLIKSILQGNKKSLEELILRHQNWIYNIALRMTANSFNAEDITQEVLIKVITKLSTFKYKSSFRTWLYRIVVNHIINMKRSPVEIFFSSFEKHNEVLENTIDADLPDKKTMPLEMNLLVEETKLQCMMGMLLCLDRLQRIIFILGAVFNVNSDIGGAICEISADNFRKILSRSRKQLYNYMNEKCGLMNKKNPCRCVRKTKSAIEAGYVDPKHLQFIQKHVENVKAIAQTKIHKIDIALGMRGDNLYKSQPFLEAPDFIQIFRNMMDNKEMKDFINFV